MKIEKLFKIALIVTFFMNMAGALAFLPPFRVVRELGGLPEAGNAFYAWVLASWVFFFGVFYLRLAFAETPERFFVAIGALGKFSFAVLLIVFAAAGELPPRAALAGAPDSLVAAVFVAWLAKTRALRSKK